MLPSVENGGSAVVYTPAHCFLGICDGFLNMAFTLNGFSGSATKKMEALDKSAEVMSCWHRQNAFHTDTAIYPLCVFFFCVCVKVMKPVASISQQIYLFTRMQLWGLLLDLLTSLCSTEFSERFKFLHSCQKVTFPRDWIENTKLAAYCLHRRRKTPSEVKFIIIVVICPLRYTAKQTASFLTFISALSILMTMNNKREHVLSCSAACRGERWEKCCYQLFSQFAGQPIKQRF